MPGFRRSIVVAAPAAAVFAALTDLRQAPRWMPGLERAEWLGGGRVEAGAVWRETRRTRRGFAEAEVRVVRCQEGRALDLRVDAARYGLDVGFDLLPAAGGTQVDFQCHAQGKGLLSFAGRSIARRVEARDGGLLLRLKAHVEGAR